MRLAEIAGCTFCDSVRSGSSEPLQQRHEALMGTGPHGKQKFQKPIVDFEIIDVTKGACFHEGLWGSGGVRKYVGGTEFM